MPWSLLDALFVYVFLQSIGDGNLFLGRAWTRITQNHYSKINVNVHETVFDKKDVFKIAPVSFLTQVLAVRGFLLHGIARKTRLGPSHERWDLGWRALRNKLRDIYLIYSRSHDVGHKVIVTVLPRLRKRDLVRRRLLGQTKCLGLIK